MSPVLAVKIETTETQPEITIDAHPATRAFYRMLDDTFGEKNWHPNTDVSYSSELGFCPVDVIAPVEQHDALYERAAEIETRMRREFGARVLIFVVEGKE